MEILERTQAPAFREISHIDFVQANRRTLDNGIPVYTVNAGSQELVRIEVVFLNRHTRRSDVLVASATNRMLAEGTAKHSAQQLADSIDYFGAFYETDEGLDANSVSLYTITKHLGKTLPVLLEILAEPSFPDKELNVFRRNSRQRLLVNKEKVSYLARSAFQEMLFGRSHPYGYVTTEQDIDALNRETLQDHFRKRYSLADCMLFVSGKAGEEVFSLLNATFGKVKASAHLNGQALQDPPVPFLEKNLFIRKPEAIQSALRIGMPLFNKMHPDYHVMLVLSTVLGGYFGSRLMANLREEKGYTYGIGSGIVSLLEGGYLVISTEVAKEVSDPAKEEIYKEIKRLTTESLPAEELQQVRNYLLGSLMRSMDGAFNLSDRAKGLVLYGLDYSYYERYLETIRKVTPVQLLETARKYFTRESFYQLEAGDK